MKQTCHNCGRVFDYHTTQRDCTTCIGLLNVASFRRCQRIGWTIIILFIAVVIWGLL